MKSIAIDIETFSSYDLSKGGVYKYVEAPDFTVLLIAYQYDNEPVQICDLTEYSFPYDLLQHLTNKNIIKTAWNANFERTALAKYLSITLDPSQWRCTMAHAAQLGLPLQLGKCAEVLKVDQQKDSDGKALIKYFSMPCKPTKVNEGRTRNLPTHNLEKWQKFKGYCVQDVKTEQAIKNKISFFHVPETEIRMWNLDQKINDTGVLLDTDFVKSAILLDNTQRAKLTAEAIDLTGLSNPNSVAQLKTWIEDETLEGVEKLNKETVPVMIEKTDCKIVERVLKIRQEMSKTSVKKYTAMVNAVCEDSRVRGLLQYYGANRTGRWGGRLIQPQNLPGIKMSGSCLNIARQLAKAKDADLIELLFDNISDTLSQLIRTSFVAREGSRFIVADFANIELVVAAWLAGEQWIIDEFNGERKIYEQTASRMMKIPVEKIAKNSPERQKGKIGSLACQFGGSVGALVKMGALRMGLTEDDLPIIVEDWRDANTKIVKYWKILQNSAIKAVKDLEPVAINYGIKFFVKNDILFTQLPSGRKLSYFKPRIEEGPRGDVLTYEGMDQTTKQWCKQRTYGGKIFENLCQSIARDCLAHAMLNLDVAGYKIPLHVHDEIVTEVPNGVGSVEEVIEIMIKPISWAKGLPLDAEGFESEYYKK